uniref:Uncharacterized protein n=1 Tax=Talaromyces marneffei PM1 TaxID=1077442 RepID=A0A093XDM9_TALMA
MEILESDGRIDFEPDRWFRKGRPIYINYDAPAHTKMHFLHLLSCYPHLKPCPSNNRNINDSINDYVKLVSIFRAVFSFTLCTASAQLQACSSSLRCHGLRHPTRWYLHASQSPDTSMLV